MENQVFEIEVGELKYEKDGTSSLKQLVLINGILYVSIREGKNRLGLGCKLKDGMAFQYFHPLAMDGGEIV